MFRYVTDDKTCQNESRLTLKTHNRNRFQTLKIIFCWENNSANSNSCGDVRRYDFS